MFNDKQQSQDLLSPISIHDTLARQAIAYPHLDQNTHACLKTNSTQDRCGQCVPCRQARVDSIMRGDAF